MCNVGWIALFDSILWTISLYNVSIFDFNSELTKNLQKSRLKKRGNESQKITIIRREILQNTVTKNEISLGFPNKPSIQSNQINMAVSGTL